MKFTIAFITLLSITTSWALKVKNTEDPKDKRETSVGYPSAGYAYQSPSPGHEEASAISIGAGYSVGGGKPSFSYGAPESSGHLSSEGLPASGHATIQLAPITLQPSHGGLIGGADLSQLMSQLSQGLNTGALTLSPYQSGGQSAHGGQEFSFPQFAQYGSPKQQQYTFSEQALSSVPSYAAGTKGLGSYSSTGPVLFSPSDSQNSQPTLTYGAPSSGHSFGDAGAISFGDAGHALAGLSLGGSGHSLGGSGHSLGGSGYSLGGSGHSLGGSGHSLGGSGHSLGGASYSLGGSGHSHTGPSYSLGNSGHSQGGPSYSLGGSGHSFGGSLKALSSGYAIPSKASFKPSTFVGSSGDSSHGLSALSGSYGTPSFGSHAFSGGHGPSLSAAGHGGSHGASFGGFGGGSSKFVAPSYLPPKSEGFGSSLESVASFSSGGHSSPPGTTYGVPSGSYLPSNSAHAASSHTPQYYVMSSKYPSSNSFGEGSTSYRGPSSGSSVSSFSSGPKYSFGGHSGPSSRYGSPKDSHGAHSETSYNTIKYSEELKPRAH